ncbi:P22 phage major capsid protein family protein [Acinetobacter sp. YH12069]|uniref:P22 phage major capsid protein family protein n=1 Tax=Acinetobacter sp. YH12069 TaxID=2601065 RepID=UPI0015D305C6|nr:P22 phage major capsid protein family protein [Acinetobacter sp. YH12069]
MANSFAKKIDVFFDDVVAGFDATNISSKNVSQYKAPAEALALNGQTFHRPMPLMTEIVDGRDITGQYKDLVELTVPATLTESHIRNVPVKLTGVDLNNPYAFDNIVKTSNILLSNKLDTLVANRVAERGTLAVINAGAIDTYDDAAEADALMLEQQATRGERIMLLNPRMAKNIAGNLAARQTMNTAPMNAYQRSTLQPIAGFDTFRVDYGKSIAGSAGAGYLVSGAQSYTPVSADSNGIPADNRTQTLAVKTGTGAAVGDVFTIAGVYAVGHINKQSTGQLKTFRILAINGGNWTISPAIVPADGTAAAQKAYANVTTGAAADAAITILNKKTTAASVFYEKSAIEIVHADFNTEPFEASGKRVRKATTDSGIQIVMLSDSNVDTLAANYRLFVWANVEVLNPELAGIMLENQT